MTITKKSKELNSFQMKIIRSLFCTFWIHRVNFKGIFLYLSTNEFRDMLKRLAFSLLCILHKSQIIRQIKKLINALEIIQLYYYY